MTTTTKTRAVRAYLLLFLAILCLGLGAAVLTFDPGDWPSPKVWPHPNPAHNALGKVGAYTSYQLFYWIGEGVYPLLFFATLATLHLMVHGSIKSPWQRVFGVMVLITGTATAVRLVAPGDVSSLPIGNGGILGSAVTACLMENFKPLGTWVILLYGMMVGLLFAAEGWVLRLPDIAKKVGEVASVGAVEIAKTVNVPRPVPLAEVGAAATRMLRSYTHRTGKTSEGQRADRDTDGGGREELKINPNRPKQAPYGKRSKSLSASEPEPAETRHDPDVDEEVGQNAEAETATPPILSDDPPPPAKAYPTELSDWEYPSLDLLEDVEYAHTERQETLVREKAKVLERTLEEFHYDAQVVEIDTGPVITMFELKLAAGIKVSRIASLSNDIARALKAPAVRVVAPLPGKNTIGIEVPNLDKEKVRLKELITLSASKIKKMALPVFIGKDASGSALVGDLASMPHMLIAGTTGSGKSVCINSIISSILMTRRPDVVKMILIDPKMVEMSQFQNVPHLMCPIVTDMARAESILEWATTKMDERYELLAEAGVRNVAAYNKLTKEEIYERFQPTSEEERAQIPLKIAYNVIIIDELADLMMTAAKEVEHHLSRLAQKSRAVGIHIVVATQRPEAKVVTGLIKSNLPCRIAFRVASRMDSRIVLDQNGAEVLMGQGDMLYLPPGSSKLIRSQGTLVEDSELKNLIEFLAERAEPEFHPDLIRMQTKGTGDLTEKDALFDKAVEIILQTKRGSVSLLQRRLMVGYSRASRLIDQMAEAGIVGAYKGSQAREVCITLDEWRVLQGGIAADEAYEADRPSLSDSPIAPAEVEGVTREESHALLDDELNDDEPNDIDEVTAQAETVDEIGDHDEEDEDDEDAATDDEEEEEEEEDADEEDDDEEYDGDDDEDDEDEDDEDDEDEDDEDDDDDDEDEDVEEEEGEEGDEEEDEEEEEET